MGRRGKKPVSVLPEIEAMLGLVSDAEIGAKAGVSAMTVCRWRQARGIAAYRQDHRRCGGRKKGQPDRYTLLRKAARDVLTVARGTPDGMLITFDAFAALCTEAYRVGPVPVVEE